MVSISVKRGQPIADENGFQLPDEWHFMILWTSQAQHSDNPMTHGTTKMRKKGNRKFFSFLFAPHYDELALFMMSYVLILLVLANNPLRTWNLKNFSIKADHPGLILIVAIFSGGFILCLYHAFSGRRKTPLEKKIMMFFAAIMNGFAGIWSGTYILVHSKGWAFSIFPVWNIISGYILILFLRTSRMEECIGDENITLGRLFLSGAIATGIFYVCHFIFVLNWAMTFSICVAWATSLSSSFNALVFRERTKITQF